MDLYFWKQPLYQPATTTANFILLVTTNFLFIAFDVHYFQFMMKRQIAAQRGRQKLNHAVSALHTINLLAGKIPEEPMPIFDPAIYRASVSVDDQPSAAGYGSDLANPARGTNIAKQFCRDIQLQNTIQQ